MINIFQPSLGNEELAAIDSVFKSNWLGKGSKTDQFEKEFSAHLGVDTACVKSISCCTEGAFQIMSAIDLKAGDEVILPTISFVGIANAIASTGAHPVFCDVDEHTLNATVETISKKITKRTKAVVIIHYGGVASELDCLSEFLKSRNIFMIEDAACSVASTYKGKHAGTFGDFGIWSFDAMKILVTGDGAMVYCKDSYFMNKIVQNSYLGLTAKSGISNNIDNKWWEFEISCLGRRAVVNDISSAIGCVQLNKLPNFIKKRKEIHEFYDKQLHDVEWLALPPSIPEFCESSYYFYWIQTQYRDRLAMHLRENGIYTTFRYFPLHKVKYYNATNAILPHAEKAAVLTLCIPIHQSLSENDMKMIVEKIKDFNI